MMRRKAANARKEKTRRGHKTSGRTVNSRVERKEKEKTYESVVWSYRRRLGRKVNKTRFFPDNLNR